MLPIHKRTHHIVKIGSQTFLFYFILIPSDSRKLRTNTEYVICYCIFGPTRLVVCCILEAERCRIESIHKLKSSLMASTSYDLEAFIRQSMGVLDSLCTKNQKISKDTLSLFSVLSFTIFIIIISGFRSTKTCTSNRQIPKPLYKATVNLFWDFLILRQERLEQYLWFMCGTH